MKRVAIITTNSHFIPFGGAGQFIKGLCQQFLNDRFIVDIILDQPPSQKQFLEDLKITGSVYYPDMPASYSKHRNTYSFSDSVNFEKESNLRDALLKALSTNIYDTIIINSVEGLGPVYTMGLDEKINVIFYTHVELSIGLLSKKDTPFTDRFIGYYSSLIRADSKIKFCTQSPRNIESIQSVFSKSAYCVPMFIPEPALLEPYDGPKEGILFNGRWEPRKRPEEFVNLCKESGMKPKVMTSTKAVNKFEKAFEKAGITDYEIRSGIYGTEKVQFIQSCEICYHPSHHENFSFSVYEALCCLPVLVDSDCYWHQNFEDLGFYLEHSTKENRAELARKLTKKNIQSDSVYKYHASVKKAWEDILDTKVENKDRNNIFTRHNSSIYLSKWYASLGRPVSIEDIMMVHSSYKENEIIQTKDGTFISKDGSVPEENHSLISRFFN